MRQSRWWFRLAVARELWRGEAGRFLTGDDECSLEAKAALIDVGARIAEPVALLARPRWERIGLS